MLNIKLIYRSLLDNHIKLMWRFSFVIIGFFYFVFLFVFIANFSSEPFKSNFNNFLRSIPLNNYEVIILFLILSILFGEVVPLASLNLKNRIVKQVKHQKILIYYPSLPLFLTTFGFFISFISGFFKILFLVPIGLIISLFGIILWAIMFNIKIYLESKISYAIHEANERISNIDTNEPLQIKQFIWFINLALNNINLKFGKNLKLNSSELGLYKFEIILRDYLPYYLKLGSTAELDSLKNHIKSMADSVNENEVMNFKIFTNELIELSKEVIKFFRDNNIQIAPRTSNLSFLRDMDNVKKLVIILFYLIPSLLILYYWYSGELTSKSLIEMIFKR